MSIKWGFLPPLAVGLLTGTICVTFYLSYIHTEHVTYFLPYISDTGTYSPESCIFGQALNVISVLTFSNVISPSTSSERKTGLLRNNISQTPIEKCYRLASKKQCCKYYKCLNVGFAMYLKYLQTKEIYQKHHIDEQYPLNKITFCIGIATVSGVSIVANFQETNVLIVHWFGAILTFGGGAIYQCLQCLIYVKISPVIGQRKITMFRIILSTVSLITFVIFTISGFIANARFQGEDLTKWKKADGGYEIHLVSTYAEWICAISTGIFLSLFYEEFKHIAVRPMAVILDEHKTSSVTNIT